MSVIHNKRFFHILLNALVLLTYTSLLLGCARKNSHTIDAYDGSEYICQSQTCDENIKESLVPNIYTDLSVPTDITRIGDDYFIVDCYHSQIIYNDSLGAPLNEWTVLADQQSCGYSLGHTIVSDGTVLLADDTENNRVLVFEKNPNKYELTQHFDNIGNKPHFIVYDEATTTFYCWSSYSGEMYLFRHIPGDSTMYLTKVQKIERLADTYVRSFTIEGDSIWFVSGLPADGSSDYPAEILEYDLYSFEQKSAYPVPAEIAGMVQMEHIDGLWYYTVSTDLYGDQAAATMICADSPKSLSSGDYSVVYDKWFVGGGTPYYMGNIDGTWYLTEHRLPGHAIWKFDVDEQGQITHSESIY